MQVLYLLYHELRSAPADYSYVVSAAAFEQSCELFEHLQDRRAPGLRPELTFDDGHISNYSLALPILQRHNLTATFFITAGWTGQRAEFMGWEELRALVDAGQRVGAHGMTHKLLTHCSSGELNEELRGARLRLEDGLGSPVTTMSLPGGRSNKAVMQACWEAGYEEVFTSLPRAEDSVRPQRSAVGRLNIRNSTSTQWLQQLLSGDGVLLRQLERKQQLKSGVQKLLGDRLYAKIWSIVNREDFQSEPSREINPTETANR